MLEIVGNWNMTVNDWLKYYVFARVDPPNWFSKMVGGNKSAKVTITRLASALFHVTPYLFCVVCVLWF